MDVIAKGLWRTVALAVFGLMLAACAMTGGTGGGGTLAESHRAEDKKIFKAAMAELRDLQGLSAQGCGHRQIGDIRVAIDHFAQREMKLVNVNNPKDLDRVRKYKWTLQFGLADEGVERHCDRLVEQLHADLTRSYKEAILGNPDAKANPDIETIRQKMGV